MARTKNSLNWNTQQAQYGIRKRIRDLVLENKIVCIDCLYPVGFGFSDYYQSKKKRRVAIEEIENTTGYAKVDGNYIINSPAGLDYRYTYKPKNRTYYDIMPEIYSIGKEFQPWKRFKKTKNLQFGLDGSIPTGANSKKLYADPERDLAFELECFKNAIDKLTELSFCKPSFVRTDVISKLVVQMSGITMRKAVKILPFNMYILGYEKFPNMNAKDRRFDVGGKGVVFYKLSNSTLDIIPKHLKKLGA